MTDAVEMSMRDLPVPTNAVSDNVAADRPGWSILRRRHLHPTAA